jgi:membrane protein DedA with SNARE-associated domain
MENAIVEACSSTGLIGDIVDWAISIINAAGYLGALLIVMIENVLPFIPSEVILPALGMAASLGAFGISGWLGNVVIVLIVTLASLIGASILFGIARLFGLERVEKIPFIKKEKVEMANNWFLKRGEWAVLICRVIPVVRVLITIPAGLSKMKFSRFLVFSTIGSLIWNTILISVGILVGENWCDWEPVFSKFSHIVVVVLLVLLILAVWIKSKVSKKASDNSDKPAQVESQD